MTMIEIPPIEKHPNITYEGIPVAYQLYPWYLYLFPDGGHAMGIIRQHQVSTSRDKASHAGLLAAPGAEVCSRMACIPGAPALSPWSYPGAPLAHVSNATFDFLALIFERYRERNNNL